MQDIPRNELLDKLAAGWKVRRKSWDIGWVVTKNGGNVATPTLLVLLSDDWEGEPPEPVCTGSLCAIVQAFEKLRDGAVFIRRPHWEKRRQITARHEFFNFETSDILANDWEVWG